MEILIKMEWKYYIVHTWKKPSDRHVWEDVYLMPIKGWKQGEKKVSVWLTVDALGKPPPEEELDELKEYQEDLEKLGKREYVIDRKTCDMLVRTVDFNMEELLNYAKTFIEEIFNDHEIVLVEGTFDDFRGTNENIIFLEELFNTIVQAERKRLLKELVNILAQAVRNRMQESSDENKSSKGRSEREHRKEEK